MQKITPHEPHPPFIRSIETRLGDSKTYRFYCTLCQRRVALVVDFGDFPEKEAGVKKWVHDEDPRHG
jgi:hypothetical protein